VPATTANLMDNKLNALDSNGYAANKWSQTIALAMFGSSSAVDMITNETATIESFKGAVVNCANSTLTSLVDTTGLNKSPAAAESIFKAMVSKEATRARFGMAYGATTDWVATTAGVAETKTFHNCVLSNTVTGTPAAIAKASVTVRYDGTNAPSVVSVEIVETASTAIAVGDSLSIALDGSKFVTIAVTNSVQAGMVNNTLSNDTPLPFEVNDKLRMVYTVNTHLDQKNIEGENVSGTMFVGILITVV